MEGVFCNILGAWGIGRSVRGESNVWDGGEVGGVNGGFEALGGC